MNYQPRKLSTLSTITIAASSSLLMIALIGNLFFLNNSNNTHTINSRAAVSNCSYTASGLDLSEYNLMLPTGAENNPTEIFQTQLKTYQDDYFYPSSDCKTLYFKSPTNGATSEGSDYPRTELRETSNGGQTRIKWSNRQGTHTMEITQAVLRLPNGKKEVVVGQVHNTSFDAVVIRLNDRRLFINTEGAGTYDLNTNYTLGTPFSIKFIAKDGKVYVYYNNSASPVFTYTRTLDTAFFKAGIYVQANCTTEPRFNAQCGAENYGLSQINRLVISHTSTTSSPTPTQSTSCIPSLSSPANDTVHTIAPTLTWSSPCQKYYQVNLKRVDKSGGGVDAYHGPMSSASFQTYANMYTTGSKNSWRVRTCDPVSFSSCINPGTWSTTRIFYWQTR